jgi:hypothetical protein
MTNGELLAMVKSNLAIITPAWNEYLTNLIEVSKQSIAREGITLKDTLEDNNLIVMYTAYLYRKRTEDTGPMPRMLRYALNNRLLSEKMQNDLYGVPDSI